MTEQEQAIFEDLSQFRLKCAKEDLQDVREKLHQPLAYQDKLDGDYRTIGFFNARNRTEPVYAHQYKRNGAYYTLSGEWIKGDSSTAGMSDAPNYEYKTLEGYRGMIKSGTEDEYHGYGMFTLSNGVQYSGEFKDKLFNGYGQYWDGPNNKVYVGEFTNKEFHGWGEQRNPDGSSKYGRWNNNRIWTGFHLKGDHVLAQYQKGEIVSISAEDLLESIKKELHQPLKYRDEPDYKDDADGKDRKIGFFDMNTPVYAHRYKWNEGGYYTLQTEFIDGDSSEFPQSQGPSEQRYKYLDDNDLYKGMISINSNKYHGYGQYTYENGVKYFGEFKEGFFNGYGEYNDYGNKQVYKGEFLNAKYHGKGMLNAKGILNYGTWSDGKLSNGVKIKGDQVLAEYKKGVENVFDKQNKKSIYQANNPW